MVQTTRPGFTLVEILIVVVLLAVLAAIVVPQFRDAADQADRTAFDQSVRIVQKQVQQFQVEQGHLPGDTSPARDGSSFDAGRFIADLTGTVQRNGKTYGPYLMEFPANPFAAAAKARTVIIAPNRPADDAGGWWFDPETRQIQPLARLGREPELED
jgi:prepilin-type N-terminal cleavage/methylation domain-containing protein